MSGLVGASVGSFLAGLFGKGVDVAQREHEKATAIDADRGKAAAETAAVKDKQLAVTKPGTVDETVRRL